ncbi:MAG: S-adenosyl-L-methionine-dependent methyltransferase [Monoraphidium minutum]|nr:MAG: S-adenosyl-L-methionine-dependent methyltransferase [Monoraphidium minutum]
MQTLNTVPSIGAWQHGQRPQMRAVPAVGIGGGAAARAARCHCRCAAGQAACSSSSSTMVDDQAELAATPSSSSSSSDGGGSSAMRRDPVDKARHVRPPGWVAPGPPPVGPQGDPDLAPRPGETLAFLSGDWRIFQLTNGHRWSLDDHVTAVVALQEARAAPPPGVTHYLDLGCGIGSVLMMVAWGLPDAKAVGVEAQEISVGLARRSVRYNAGAASGRVSVHRGDLRDPLPPGAAPPGGFDLITGTPPYIPRGDGGVGLRPQKEPCNLETRGGVEEYVAAAAAALAPGGSFVVVMGVQGQRRRDRVAAAAAAHGLAVSRCVEVVPREGKPALMHVYVLRWRQDCGGGGGSGEPQGCTHERFVVRLADGRLGPDMHAARAAIGMPPAKG